MVAAGDTLSAIAAALAVRGGWPALYAANRRVIGPDPDVIRPGTVLAIPRPAAPRAPGAQPGPPCVPGAAVGAGWQRAPSRAGRGAPAAGMPSWLKTVLLAAGLLIGAAFVAEPVLAVRRRRRAASPGRTGAAAAGAGPARAARPLPLAGPGRLADPACGGPGPAAVGRLPRAGPASWWLITTGWW